ncbi:MAG: 16S rRNA (cytidine(1402)-2'-O)-methyltransferase [Paracoccaceae bacterium]
MVATPIGHARDITLRALDILASADVLAAEDTRSLRRLMEIHGIALNGRQVVAYHDHNGPRARPGLLRALAAGQSVAYASEAGTPLIADPGFDLVREAIAEGYAVTTAPGPTAMATAVTIAGLPTDRVLFAGFVPSARSGRRKALAELRDVPATLVFYESPKRLAAFLADAQDVLGDRPAAVCRELTKKFEQARRGLLSDMVQEQAETPARGEIVVVVDRGRSSKLSTSDLDDALRRALGTMSVRDAADFVSVSLNLPRRQVYQHAMKVKRDDDPAGAE